MSKINTSKHTFRGAMAILFLIMLTCNAMVHLFSDDFIFVFNYASFQTGEFSRIDGLSSIFESLRAIYQYENGRLVAHFFSQLFLYLPGIIFKILNSAMFVLEIYLMYRLCVRNSSTPNTFFFLVIFGCIWIFQPAFGEAHLWLDGACNYLWCYVFNLLFLFPFWNKYLFNKGFHHAYQKILLVVFSFFVGAYGETASLGTLVVCLLLLAFTKWQQHAKIDLYLILSVLFFCCGFLFMMSSPAEISNKFSDLSLFVFLENMVDVLHVYYEMRYLLIAFVVLFTLAVIRKRDQQLLIGSAILFFGSLCSIMALCFADYAPPRSAGYCCVLLIVACGVLFFDLLNTEHVALLTCVGAVTLLFTLYYGILGFQDMYATHYFMERNEQLIAQEVDAGNMDVEIDLPPKYSKYSQIYSFPYINEKEGRSLYPNIYMAQYYGISTIYGVE